MTTRKESFSKAAISKRPWLLVPIIGTPFFFIGFVFVLIFGDNFTHNNLAVPLHILFWSGCFSILVSLIFNPFSKQEMKDKFNIIETHDEYYEDLHRKVSNPAYSFLAGNFHHEN